MNLNTLKGGKKKYIQKDKTTSPLGNTTPFKIVMYEDNESLNTAIRMS